MRIGILVASAALLVCASAAPALAEDDSPLGLESRFLLQGDGFLGGVFPHDGGAFTGGGELGVASVAARPGAHPFLAEIVEVSGAGTFAPYQVSGGAGTRIGVAWFDGRHRTADTLLYVRVLPFIARGQLPGEDARLSGGARLGVGVTSMGWTRYGYRHFGEGGIGGGDISSFACALFVDAILPLLNHGEVGVELRGHDSHDTEGDFYFRLGFGF